MGNFGDDGETRIEERRNVASGVVRLEFPFSTRGYVPKFVDFSSPLLCRSVHSPCSLFIADSTL
jgi:hypothetical protein